MKLVFVKNRHLWIFSKSVTHLVRACSVGRHFQIQFIAPFCRIIILKQIHWLVNLPLTLSEFLFFLKQQTFYQIQNSSSVAIYLDSLSFNDLLVVSSWFCQRNRLMHSWQIQMESFCNRKWVGKETNYSSFLEFY